MEFLGILEKKIENLITLVKELRQEKSSLVAANALLHQKIEALEATLLKYDDDMHQNRISTQKAIDALIANIDILLIEEQQ